MLCTTGGDMTESSKRRPRFSPRYLASFSFHGCEESSCEASTARKEGGCTKTMLPSAPRRIRRTVSRAATSSMATSRLARSKRPPLTEKALSVTHGLASRLNARLNSLAALFLLSRFFRLAASPSTLASKGSPCDSSRQRSTPPVILASPRDHSTGAAFSVLSWLPTQQGMCVSR